MLDRLPAFDAFARVARSDLYAPLPDEWTIGLTDVADSTAAVAAGRYKAVNIAGAAAISALMNALGTRAFPFAFGGDGCVFALPPEHAVIARDIVAKTAAWVRDDLRLDLRTAMVTVGELRAGGQDVRVAMFQPTEHVAYAMFDGGGIAFAEAAMKAGRFLVPPAGRGARPDLSGLSCRWLPIPARNGNMLSIIVRRAEATDRAAFGRCVSDLLALIGEETSGRPVPDSGPEPAIWTPGMRLEALASRGSGSTAWRMARVFAHNLMGWLLFTTGLRAGSFDPPVYRAMTAKNADYRKFSDGLSLTADCDAGLEQRLVAFLDERAAAGTIRFGLHRQPAALMTCVVPSYEDHSHFHFIDGAGGGYTEAARNLKSRAAG